MSRVVSRLVVFGAFLFFCVFASVSVEAVDPGYPANIYIWDVKVGSPGAPLNFNDGGAGIKLTREGVNVGKWSWNGATGLALFTIDSWRRQTGKQWPYHWRSVDSVAREIQVHCWSYGYRNTTRPITISFNGW